MLAAGLALFPELVYDRFIWQYLWGPVVADAASEPVTYQGIRAVPGYNPVNTVVYLGIVLYSLLGIGAYLDALNVDLDTRLAYGLAPIVIASGAMRALEDVRLLGQFDVLFITPSIYFVVAGATIASLALGAFLRDRSRVSIPLTVGVVSTGWAVVAIARAVSYGLVNEGTVRLVVPFLTTGVALGVTGAFYLVGSMACWTALHRPMYLLVVFGQRSSVEASTRVNIHPISGC